MTDLEKRVRRRSTGRHRGARYVVELIPGDVIGFRRERSREWYFLDLAACYDLAMRRAAEAKRRKLVAERAARRKGR